MNNPRISHAALRITSVYAMAAIVWILFSDYALLMLVPHPLWNDVLHTTKGLFFVAVTTVVLYLIMHTELCARERSETMYRTTAVRLEHILEIAANAMIAVDENHHIQLFNPAAELIFGYTAQEVINKPFAMLLEPAFVDAYYDYANEVASTASVQRSGMYFEVVGHRRYGKTFPAELSVAASSHNKHQTFTIIIRDITDQKQAEEDLIASRDRIRTILESITDAFFTLDTEWRFIYLNHEAEKLLRHTREELLEQNVWEMFPPAVHTQFYQQYHRAYREQVTVSFEEYYPPMETWFDVHAYPSQDGLTVYFRDVTERKRAEQELQRVNRALKTLSACNQTLVRATNEQELLERICQDIVEVGCYTLAWVGYAEPEEPRRILPVAQAGDKSGYLESLHITWADDEWGQGPTGRAVRMGKIGVVRDMATDPTYHLWRERAIQYGYTSSIALPLVFGDSTRTTAPQRGALNIYSPEPDAFDTTEIHLLTELAEDIAYGIRALRIREEHRRIEEQMKIQKTLLEAQSEAVVDGLLIVSPQDEWLFENKRFLEMWDIPNEIVITRKGSLVYQLMSHKVTAPDVFDTRLHYLDEHPHETSWDPIELQDGRIFDIYSAPVLGTEGAYYGRIWSYRDITERVRLFDEVRTSHERLQTLSRRLVEIQEAERRHIARELHDEIGQALTGLHLILEMVGRLPASEPISTRLKEAHTLVSELMSRVRELSLNLRPAMLDDLGLLPTLRWYFHRYMSQTNIRVAFKHTDIERRFAPEVETVVYRVIQEALTNTARYAQADEVTVRLWSDLESLGLQIEDQGVGFDPQEAFARNTSSGLAGMHERVLLLDGELTIESSPGNGTCLIVELPLQTNQIVGGEVS